MATFPWIRCEYVSAPDFANHLLDRRGWRLDPGDVQLQLGEGNNYVGMHWTRFLLRSGVWLTEARGEFHMTLVGLGRSRGDFHLGLSEFCSLQEQIIQLAEAGEIHFTGLESVVLAHRTLVYLAIASDFAQEWWRLRVRALSLIEPSPSNAVAMPWNINDYHVSIDSDIVSLEEWEQVD